MSLWPRPGVIISNVVFPLRQSIYANRTWSGWVSLLVLSLRLHWISTESSVWPQLESSHPKIGVLSSWRKYFDSLSPFCTVNLYYILYCVLHCIPKLWNKWLRLWQFRDTAVSGSYHSGGLISVISNTSPSWQSTVPTLLSKKYDITEYLYLTLTCKYWTFSRLSFSLMFDGFMSFQTKAAAGVIWNIKSEMTTVYF